MSEPLISNISDTARWIAVYRAMETARPDALFKDPFADRLAGERGRAIAAAAPRQTRNGWPWVMRTKLIDNLILTSVAEGCDRVLNLAAGFDTRPYRLPLPSGLSWIEADLPLMITEKERLLGSEKPACELRRESVDLTVPSERNAFLSAATSGAARTLVLTEGLLVYLEDDIVRSLGCDLAGRPAIRWWIIDLSSPAILSMMQKQMGANLNNAPLRFAPPNGIAFFESCGWKARDIHSLLRSAVRFKRAGFLLRIISHFPEPDLRNFGKARWGGIIRLEK